MFKQTCLRYGREPLQIYVPSDFTGQRSTDEKEIFLSTQMVPLTLDEIALCQEFVKTLTYKQALVFGAVMIDADDPLLGTTHDKLDEIERSERFTPSRYAIGGGERSVYERVLILRESGYLANGLKQLAGSPA